MFAVGSDCLRVEVQRREGEGERFGPTAAVLRFFQADDAKIFIHELDLFAHDEICGYCTTVLHVTRLVFLHDPSVKRYHVV